MGEMGFEELQQIVSVCLDEVVKLKDENERLRIEIQGIKNSMSSCLEAIKKISGATISFEQTSNIQYKTLCSAIDNIKYEIGDESSVSKLFYPKIANIKDTINELVVEKKSMARFGDGEFSIMSGYVRHGFQKYDDRLAKLLRETIAYNDDGFLIGIGNIFGNLNDYNIASKQEIRAYMTEQRRREILKYLDENRLYHNAYITRPYAMYEDNTTNAPIARFSDLQRIWDGRDVVFVEGEKTRLGVGNDLFNNVNSIRRIEAPATDSFSCYDRILEASLSHAEHDTLFLIALGPTAGVLAYDIFKKGYQAIDIGHLDLEYEWMKCGNGGRCEVKNKYNNEFPGGDEVINISDKKYESEIIWKY